MRVKRSTILVLAAWLALLPGCGRVTTSVEQRDALLPTEVATQALSWNIETLDVSGMPYGPVAMASGSDGTHHIAFYENVDDVLRYVSGQSASWSDAETVGSAHDTVLDSGSVSMVLGSDDVPRIGYYAPGGALAYATRADGAWPVTADVVSPYATYISLAVDVDGTTHVVFTDSSGLHHAEQTSDGWSVSTVLANPASGNVGSGAVALDGEGHPQVAVMWTEYVYPTLWAKLGYAEAAYDADGRITWSPVTVVAAYASAASAGVTALALDGSDHPHIAYRSGFGHLTYVAHDGSAWGTPELVDVADSYAPSIALDGSGDPHVAYLVRPAGASTETMHYGVRGDNGWSTETVDEAGDAGAPSLAVDAFDRPHIAYILDTGTANTLRYATVADPVAGYVVSNGNDAGEGSLRQMVLDAPAGATITFASDVSVVTLTSGSLELTKDVTIAGPEAGTVTIRGGEGFAYTVVRVPVAGVDVVFRNLTITGGQADGTVAYGGGIRVDWPGAWTLPQTEPPSLRLERCTVSGNTAHVGGGLYVEGNLTIDASTVSGNYAGSMGGGIEYTGTDLDETWTYTAAATIRNSTFSGNIAESGGAALNNYSGEVTLLFTTVTGNRATKTSDGGGIYASEDAATRTRLKGSIVVGNTSWWMGELADDISGGGTNLHYESLGYNLIGAGSGRVDFDVQFRMPGDLTGVTDGGLGALADNGGPTLTHALAATSLAIGRVPSAACTDLAGTDLGSDQRGEARPFATSCDAGAVESTDVIASYILDVTAAPAEGGSVAGANTYVADATATLTATPAEHWHFVEWRGDASGTAATATLTMDGNKAGTATFAQDRHLVQGSVEPAGSGSVVHDPTSTDGTYAYGSSVALDPVAAEGYAFSHWNDDATATSDPWTFEVTGAVTYTAHFVPLRQLTLVVDPSTCTGCRIDASPSGGTYPEGEVVTLTAVPAANWRFVGWTGTEYADGTSATVTMDVDRTVTATFEQDVFTVSTAQVGQGTVKVTPLQDTYLSGTEVTVTAEAASGWRFDHWNDDPTWVDTSVTFAVTADVTMTANFVQTHVLTVFTTDGGFVLVEPQPPYDHGDTVTLEARPFSGWHFAGWSGAVEGSTTPVDVTMDADKSVTAQFERDAYSVTWDTEGQGTVALDPEKTAYPYEDVVELTANPDPGWQFDYWMIDGDRREGNPISVEVTGDTAVTAHFSLAEIDFEPVWQGEGVVSVEPSTGPYYPGDEVTVTATAAAGWFFQTWNGDLAGAPATTTVTLVMGVSVEAVFQPIVGPMVRVALEGESEGEGYVTSEPAGIDCHASGPSVCEASFPRNTKLTLTAVAADGASFLRWTGTVPGIEPDLNVRLREDVTVTAYFVALNGAEVAIDPMGSFRANTAVVTGSLVCASGSYPLDVSISQVVPVKKGDPVTITAVTTVDAVCGQPWTATLVAADGRFVRGEAVVTVTLYGDVLRTRTVELR